MREAVINWMDRAAIVALLEGVSIQCRDDESDDVLREALRANLMDGTIPFDEIDTDMVPDRSTVRHPFANQR